MGWFYRILNSRLSLLGNLNKDVLCVGCYKELERTGNSVTCISSHYTGKSFRVFLSTLISSVLWDASNYSILNNKVLNVVARITNFILICWDRILNAEKSVFLGIFCFLFFSLLCKRGCLMGLITSLNNGKQYNFIWMQSAKLQKVQFIFTNNSSVRKRQTREIYQRAKKIILAGSHMAA